MKKVTIIRVDNGQPFILDAQIETNSDGSVSFKLPDGTYAGQEPNVYGLRHDGPAAQPYQRATLSGSIVTFVTREQDPPMVYLIGPGQVYPS